MIQRTNKEDNRPNVLGEPRPMIHDRQTYLLLVQSIEICAGRIAEAVYVINNKDSDRFIQLACTISDRLNLKVLLFQVKHISQ
jgi:ent-copalyl diphosphate synthase